jgi:hypothetical protein
MIGLSKAQNDSQAVFDRVEGCVSYSAQVLHQARLIGSMHLLSEQHAVFAETTFWRFHRHVQRDTSVPSRQRYHHAQS